ncbi:kelch-like protein 21 [Ptychodera flava]|uniref:kelch-like protein 21 n=1 Tax=Ptychodera flava TaxID=63121 RepID=UPI00396A3575
MSTAVSTTSQCDAQPYAASSDNIVPSITDTDRFRAAILENLDQMRRDDLLVDVKLRDTSTFVGCHGVVAAAASSLIEERLISEVRDGRKGDISLEFHDLQAKALKTLVDIIYDSMERHGDGNGDGSYQQLLGKFNIERKDDIHQRDSETAPRNVQRERAAGYATQILAKIHDFRTREFLTDIRIITDASEISCHKCMLAASSDYFKAMFSHRELRESDQTSIAFPEVPADIMDILIDTCYGNFFQPDEDNVQEILQHAVRFQCNRAKQLCCDFIADQIDASNCLGILHMAESYGCCDLIEKASKFSAVNLSAIIDSEEFLELPAELMCRYLKRDDLVMDSEEIALDAFVSWLRQNNSRIDIIQEIIDCIRFPYILPKRLKSYLWHDVRQSHISDKLERFQHETDSDNVQLCRRYLPRNYAKVVTSLKCESMPKRLRIRYFCPANNEWSGDGIFGEAPPIDSHSVSIAAASAYKKMFIFVFTTDGKSYMYDVKLDEWSEKEPHGLVSEVDRKYSNIHAFALTSNIPFDSVFLFWCNLEKTVRRYNIIEDQWEDIAPLIYTYGPDSGVVATQCKGKIYATSYKSVRSVDGQTSAMRGVPFQAYDPEKDSWKLVSPRAFSRWCLLVSTDLNVYLLTPRYFIPERKFFFQDEYHSLSQMSRLGDGRIFIHRYDPDENTWDYAHGKVDIFDDEEDKPSAIVYGDRIYVMKASEIGGGDRSLPIMTLYKFLFDFSENKTAKFLIEWDQQLAYKC